MFKFNIDRYDIILSLIILLLTGSILVSPGDSSKLVFQEPRYPYRIALTFDDGPHPHFTGKLMSLLRIENVPATFFVVGRQVMQYPYLVNMIDSCGHEIAGHTFTHRNMSRLSENEIEKELVLTGNLIKGITGKENRYFRPPGGQYNRSIIKKANELGFSMVLWSVFPKDHEEKFPEKIIERVLDQAHDGGVILLHSGVPATYEALPSIIKELRNRGYKFVTVSKLISYESGTQIAWLK